jgi:cell division protein ZapA
MAKENIRVQIHGLEYLIVTDQPEEHIAALAAKLDEDINRIMAGNTRISATQAAVLCALDALDAAHQETAKSYDYRKRIEADFNDMSRLKQESERYHREAEQLRREVAALRQTKRQ